jgi:rhamnosyltransferase
MNIKIDISVVIPVKNGRKYLDSLLKTVFSQEVSTEFEVIIVDSGSTDGSLDIAGRYPVSVYQIKESEFNHGLTRNFGISKARGEYVILMTQDAVPADDCWMKKLIENLQTDAQVAGAYSRQTPHNELALIGKIRANRFFASSPIKRVSQINNMADYKKLSPKERYHFCNFDNVSSCLRKSIWERFPLPKTDFAEDLEWSKMVLGAGYKIVYEPESVVYHSHNFSVFEWHKRSLVNSEKLFELFKLNTVCNYCQLFSKLFLYTMRDIYCICKSDSRISSIVLNIFLAPAYSFYGLLGQYVGARKAVLKEGAR